MSEPEIQFEKQTEEKEPMEAQKVPIPTDGSPSLEPEEAMGQDQMVTQPGGEGGRVVCARAKNTNQSPSQRMQPTSTRHV